MRKMMAMLLGLVALGAVACSEQLPTGVDEDLLPDEPVTLEVRLSWEQFASNLEVFGGYGTPLELGAVVVAHEYAGVLEARALMRFTPMPGTVTVTDSAGTQRTDDQLTLIGGRLVAFLDTIQSVSDGPVTLEVATTSEKWDRRSVSWRFAVDTVGEQRAWAQEGAGPVSTFATAVWDPAAGDSVVFPLDSAQVEMLRDTAEVNQGVRISVVTGGSRLKLNSVLFRGSVIPSVRPDTVADVTSGRQDFTFVYSPSPEAEPEGIRIGGAPAWRTVLDLDLPATLSGPAALCAAVKCPVRLTPDQVSYAALVLKGRRGSSAFQPSDSLGVDIRPVYQRSAMPKAPLGPSLLGALGKRAGPDLFGEGEGQEFELPITNFVRALVAGDSIRGFPPPKTLALLSVFEPSSLTFASFFGPGSPNAPVLKLIITAGRTVELP